MESDLIAWLSERLPPHPCLAARNWRRRGCGAAGPAADCVMTVDIISDQVDFHLDQVDPRRVGHKALGVNLSDLAAMAAVRVRRSSACAAPSRRSGLGQIALRRHAAAGRAFRHGDCRRRHAHLGRAAAGEHHGPRGSGPGGLLRRHGAQPGDQLLVTGQLGGSLLGRHLDFEPRVREALLLKERYDLHAGIDISDGLAIDLARLADASGCGAVIDLPRCRSARRRNGLRRPAATPHSVGACLG